MSLKKVKKGDTVIMVGFTGMQMGVFPVVKADEKKITIEKADGTQLAFNRKDGKQSKVEEGKERFANKIIEDDGTYKPPQRKKKADKKKDKKDKKSETVS